MSGCGSNVFWREPLINRKLMGATRASRQLAFCSTVVFALTMSPAVYAQQDIDFDQTSDDASAEPQFQMEMNPVETTDEIESVAETTTVAMTDYAAARALVESEGGAVFRGLDKTTARVTDLFVPLTAPVIFGSLEIATKVCNKRPPEEPPEKTAFLQIIDAPPGEEPAQVFSGWMFASSPALNALEHPVYDVWLIDCITIEPETVEAPLAEVVEPAAMDAPPSFGEVTAPSILEPELSNPFATPSEPEDAGDNIAPPSLLPNPLKE